MTFSKGKRGERQTGKEGEGRERERKLFLLQNLRLSCKYRHTSVIKRSGKGRNVGHAYPMKTKLLHFFFFTICTKHIAS